MRLILLPNQASLIYNSIAVKKQTLFVLEKTVVPGQAPSLFTHSLAGIAATVKSQPENRSGIFASVAYANVGPVSCLFCSLWLAAGGVPWSGQPSD